MAHQPEQADRSVFFEILFDLVCYGHLKLQTSQLRRKHLRLHLIPNENSSADSARSCPILPFAAVWSYQTFRQNKLPTYAAGSDSGWQFRYRSSTDDRAGRPAWHGE